MKNFIGKVNLGQTSRLRDEPLFFPTGGDFLDAGNFSPPAIEHLQIFSSTDFTDNF